MFLHYSFSHSFFWHPHILKVERLPCQKHNHPSYVPSRPLNIIFVMLFLHLYHSNPQLSLIFLSIFHNPFTCYYRVIVLWPSIVILSRSFLHCKSFLYSHLSGDGCAVREGCVILCDEQEGFFFFFIHSIIISLGSWGTRTTFILVWTFHFSREIKSRCVKGKLQEIPRQGCQNKTMSPHSLESTKTFHTCRGVLFVGEY